MIEVVYHREVPYSPTIVLSQYFDLEHLEHVHPRSFGRARMVSEYRNIIVWELEWPPILGLFRLRSRFAQEYNPPQEIRSVIIGGLLRGTKTVVRLDETEAGTLVTEHHQVALPAWRWLRGWVQRAWLRRLDRIWEEDLAVKLCRGGWPGLPRIDRDNWQPGIVR
jgi:hypothetical protein